MKYFAVAVLALIACQGCLAKPKPKVEVNHVEELVQNAQNLGKKIEEQFGIKNFDANEVSNTLTENTKKLTEALQSFVAKMDAERKAHEGEINTGIKTVQDKLAATIADLQKAAGPDATKKATEIQAEFDKGYKSAVEQVQLFYKTHEPELKNAQDNINKFSQNLLNSMLEIGNNVEKKVKDAIEEHEKTHKH